MVLHESIVADNWDAPEYYPPDLLDSPIFATFPSISVIPGGPWREDPAAVNDGLVGFATAIFGDALDRLERGLSSGELARQYARVVEQLGAAVDFSPVYVGPRNLGQEIDELYSNFALPDHVDDDDKAERRRVLTLENAISSISSMRRRTCSVTPCLFCVAFSTRNLPPLSHCPTFPTHFVRRRS